MTIDTKRKKKFDLGPFTFISGVTLPSSDGQFRYLSGLTGITGKHFGWYDGTSVQYAIGVDTLPVDNGDFEVYNATTDKLVYVQMSGDIAMDEDGVTTIQANSVDASMINDWYAYDTLPIAWFNGGTAEPDALDDSTRPPYAYRTFAHDSTEDLNGVWFVPSDLSGSTVQFRVKYLVTNATGPSAEGVAFTL